MCPQPGLSAGAESQRKLTSYQKYISKYSDLAIQHQKEISHSGKYHLSARITGIRSWAKRLGQTLQQSLRYQMPFGLARRQGLSRRRPAGRVLPEIQTSRGFLWWPFPLPRRTLPLRTPVQIKHQGLQSWAKGLTKMRLRHRSCLTQIN